MRRRSFLRIAALGLAASVAGQRGSAAAVRLANPMRVTGPVTGGKLQRPFGSSLTDLRKIGYIEEEYFLSGDATHYRADGELTIDGRWNLESAGTAPFTTRLLVRRPIDAGKFNGTVLVEWLNVSAGHDILSLDDIEGGAFGGFAQVGVSAQYVSVNGFSQNSQGLKAWDPERYGNLSIPSESLCYDIFSQAARAVGPARDKRSTDPMGGMAVRKLIAVGGSQSATRLLSYINGIQPRDKLFDAIVPAVSPGVAAGFGDEVLDFSKSSDLGKFVRIPTRVRDDLAVPVMIVNSETEVEGMYALRQPDSEKFRYWEVAGASHAPAGAMRINGAIGARDGVGGLPTPGRRPSEVEWAPVAHAAYVHVHGWINGSTPPSSQLPIEVQPDTPPRVVRDKYGNARGGVRLPELDVPIARYAGHAVGGGMTVLLGETEPFPADEITRLYPTHEAYVTRVTAAARAAEKAGVILPDQTQRYIDAAKARS